MRVFLLSSLLLSGLAFSLPSSAQQRDGAPIERQMSAEEFKAAGLDKLSPAELARLNAWLNRTVVQESTKAREEGRQEVVKKHRGFFDFGDGEVIESRLVGEFRGFASRREYTLENGETWQQTDATTLYGVRGNNLPVTIRPGVLGAWWMRVEGSGVQAKVKRIK